MKHRERNGNYIEVFESPNNIVAVRASRRRVTVVASVLGFHARAAMNQHCGAVVIAFKPLNRAEKLATKYRIHNKKN